MVKVNVKVDDKMTQRWELMSFDLDGTLVDSAGEIAQAVNATLGEAGLPQLPEARIRSFVGAGTHNTLRRALGWLREDGVADVPPAEPWLAALDAHYGALAGRSAQCYAGCHEMLAALRAHGVRLACVTNKEYAHTLRVLEGTGLAQVFDCVIGGDSLPQRKPDARVLQHVLAQLGCAAERSAHVGDSRVDVEAARAAGLAAWAVPWGYDNGEPIALSGPDVIFDSLGAVADRVLSDNAATRGNR